MERKLYGKEEKQQQPSKNSERQYVRVCVCVRAGSIASTVHIFQSIYFVSSQCVYLLETSRVIFVQLYCMLFVQSYRFIVAELGLRFAYRCGSIPLKRLAVETWLGRGRLGDSGSGVTARGLFTLFMRCAK